MLCRLQCLCVAVFPWEHSLAQGLQYCLVWAGEVVTEWQWLQSGSGYRVAVVTGTVLGWSVYPRNHRILERVREKDRERGDRERVRERKT